MPPQLTKPLKSLHGIQLPSTETPSNLTISPSPNPCITTITPSTSSHNDTPLSTTPLLLPPLTHPHIHLDKAFIHGTPSHAAHLPCTGTFPEALTLTTAAKSRFTVPDLLQRGEWLIAESVASGVTAMRAFVEVDHTVQLTCLEASRVLKERWRGICELQVVCFAQDPVFSGPFGEVNRGLMETGVLESHVQVLGSTPYVDGDGDSARKNIDWAIECALRNDLHLDFHLDYNLDTSKDPLVWYVVRRLKEKGWNRRTTDKRVMLGHCTRLTLFSDDEWGKLAAEIRHSDLPVSFVGLPTSDMYMAAPPSSGPTSNGKPRGTLHVPDMIRKYGLDAVIGVNNVGNAFTPWGSPDPLSLACLGVGVYQTGTQADAELLYECVSTRARAAIGLPVGISGPNLALRHGDSPDFLLVYNVDETGCRMPRVRRSIADVVWDPPGRLNRVVASQGRLVVKPMAELRNESSPGTVLEYEE